MSILLTSPTSPAIAVGAWVAMRRGGPIELTAPTGTPNLLVAGFKTTYVARLTWNAIARATGYRIWVDAGSGFVQHDTTSALLYDYDAGEARTLQFYVVATNSEGDGPDSSVQEQVVPVPLEATVLESYAEFMSFEAELTWDAVDGADEYDIYSQADGGGFSLLDTTALLAYTFDAGVSAGTYQFYVVAKNSIQEASSSNTVTEPLPGESESGSYLLLNGGGRLLLNAGGALLIHG